jgi:hypothetical protein
MQMLLLALAVLITSALPWRATLLAQETQPQTLWGRIGLGVRAIDETGGQQLFVQRAYLGEGVLLRDTAIYYNTPFGMRIDLEAPRVDDLGHDVRFRIDHPIVKGGLRSAYTQFFYNPDASLRSKRKHFSSELVIRPARQLELFGNYGNVDRSGDRQAIIPGDEGYLGTFYDQDTSTGRAGLRFYGLRSTLQLAYVGRELEVRSVPGVDRTLDAFDAQLRSRPARDWRLEALYARGLTKLKSSGQNLESDRVSARLDYDMSSAWSLGPLFRFQQSTDDALGITSKIWALGLGAGRRGARWDARLDGELGERFDANGNVNTWGANLRGGVDLTHGFRLRLRYRQDERLRDAFNAPQPPLQTSISGSRRLRLREAKLRHRLDRRWNSEVRVSRLRRDYAEVFVRQNTWRYGLETHLAPHDVVRFDLGWRLDDTADDRSTGRFDLRANVFFAEVGYDPIPRLRLVARVDVLDMRRAIEIRKTFVTGGLDVDVWRDTTLGVHYEWNEYTDDLVLADQYEANIVLFTLRQGFGF